MNGQSYVIREEAGTTTAHKSRLPLHRDLWARHESHDVCVEVDTEHEQSCDLA